jgi:hypothetical protein
MSSKFVWSEEANINSSFGEKVFFFVSLAHMKFSFYLAHTLFTRPSYITGNHLHRKKDVEKKCKNGQTTVILLSFGPFYVIMS